MSGGQNNSTSDKDKQMIISHVNFNRLDKNIQDNDQYSLQKFRMNYIT